jgi:RNA polymerase-binding transcription factor DksA
MAVGWAPDGAVQDQIDATVESAVARARPRIPPGAAREPCVDGDEPLPAARRRAVPGVRRCVRCQTVVDGEEAGRSLYNRRGNTASQLK